MDRGFFIEPLMTEEEAACTATTEEIMQANTFPSLRRRCEYLTWRAVVRRHTDSAIRIAYNTFGAPYLPDHPHIHLGISHCNGWVAVCISDRPCAVDIEPTTRNFRAVEARCIRPEERALSDHPLLPAVIWCAKETLYKLAEEQEGLDFLDDLHITALDIPGGTAAGSIRSGIPIELSVRQEHGLIIVYKL